MKQDATRYDVNGKLGPNDSHSFILKYLGDSSRILDVGCATGFIGKALAGSGATVTGIELDPVAAELARPHYQHVIVGDVTATDVLERLTDESFDCVVLGDILEHLVDPWSFAGEISRKLEEGGRLIVSIPNLGHASVVAALVGGGFRYQGIGLLDQTHLRFFSLESLCSLLIDAGLTPEEVSRVTHGSFETEIPVPTENIPPALLNVLEQCPEARTYQFVVKATRTCPTSDAATYAARFALPLWDQGGESISAERDLFATMERMRQENRDLHQQIGTCMTTIREKERIITEVIPEKDAIIESVAEERNRLRKVADPRHVREKVEKAVIQTLSGLEVRNRSTTLHPCTDPYAILVPIYNGFDYLTGCIDSILSHTDPRHPVYLLDDASPDPRVLPLLEGYAQQHTHVHVIPVEQNLGFVGNMNRGFDLTDQDVVILNSDTEVTPGWLERLDRCRRSRPRIGVVSPLSNNATILSVPEMNAPNQLPQGMSVAEFATLIAELSSRAYPRIPTAVGFCMLMTRELLDAIGGFDPVFGAGYGEECDFCMRSWQQGFEVVCCDDAYVHHYGEASFGSGETMNAKRQRNQEILQALWPSYQQQVLSYCWSNPLRELQERMLRALRQSADVSKPHILHVIHSFGTTGGTELHTKSLITELNAQFRSTLVYPRAVREWTDLYARQVDDNLRVAIFNRTSSTANDFFSGYPASLTNPVIEQTFARFVAGGDYDIIHFQHLIGWDTLMLPAIAKHLGKKVVLSIHDYFMLCPEFNLIFPDLRRCGKEMADEFDPQCLACLESKRDVKVAVSKNAINDYVGERSAVVRHVIGLADLLITPSEFVANQLCRAFGEDLRTRIRVITHGVAIRQKSPRPSRVKTLRVGFLGNLTDRKGAEVLLAAAAALNQEPIAFEVFGGVAPAYKDDIRRLGLKTHGSYRPEELPSLLKKVDLIIIPSIWDETFCLTVSEAMAMGVPVLASAAGAIAERIVDGNTGFLFPPGDVETLVSKLRALAADRESLTEVIVTLREAAVKSIPQNMAEYADTYRELLSETHRPTFLDEETIRQEGRARASIKTALQANPDGVTSAGQQQTDTLTSIIILSCNQQKYTMECIESIRRHTPQLHELVLVDNGSSDGTVKWLRQLVDENPGYQLIENSTNLGFAAGCNQGISVARGEYIVLLNNDTVVNEGWLAGLLACHTQGEKVGIAAPMSNAVGGLQRVARAHYDSMADMNSFARNFTERTRGRRRPVRKVAGLCMLFRRELAEEIGPLDERFGSGNFEDDDFCLRAELAGYSQVIAGDVFVHHYGSQTFKGNKIDYRRAYMTNQRIFSEKWAELARDGVVRKRLATLGILERARDLHWRGLTDEAVRLLIQRAIPTTPDDERIYITIAELLLQTGKYDEARQALDECPASQHSLRWQALYGFCLEGLGNLSNAQQLGEEILAVRPGYPPVLNLLGQVAYHLGDHKQAERFFLEAMAADPGNGDTFTNMGVILWQTGNQDQALAFLERGAILSPASPDILAAYHGAICQLELFSQAEQVYRDALSLFPQHRLLACNLIECLLRQGKHAEALAMIEQGIVVFGPADDLLAAGMTARATVGPLSIGHDQHKEPTVSLCMIARDEDKNLPRCLLSVRPLVNEIIVVDTGSMDRTRDIAVIFGAHVVNTHWQDDFAAARNMALEHASGDWVLALDADEVLASSDYTTFRKLFAKQKKGNVAYRFVTRNYVSIANVSEWQANDGRYPGEEAGSGWVPSCKVRLFPRKKGIAWVSPIHEMVEPTLHRLKIPIRDAMVPIHHYGKLDANRETTKLERYFDLGIKKLAEQGETPDALRELAVQAAGIGRFSEAVELWHRFLAHCPNVALAHFNLGFAYLQLNDFTAARATTRRALELNPNLFEAVPNLAISEICSGNMDEAITSLENAIKQRPDLPANIAMLAAACILSGKGEQGDELFAQLQEQGVEYRAFLNDVTAKLKAAGKDEFVTMLVAKFSTKNNGRMVLPESKRFSRP